MNRFAAIMALAIGCTPGTLHAQLPGHTNIVVRSAPGVPAIPNREGRRGDGPAVVHPTPSIVPAATPPGPGHTVVVIRQNPGVVVRQNPGRPHQVRQPVIIPQTFGYGAYSTNLPFYGNTVYPSAWYPTAIEEVPAYSTPPSSQ